MNSLIKFHRGNTRTKEVYGWYKENEWIEVFDFKKYEINHLSQIRNKKTKHILKPSKRQEVRLVCSDGKTYSKLIYHLALLSFFPQISRNERTVDHLDENHRNNSLDNLVWESREENTRKSHIFKPRRDRTMRFKSVEQWSSDGLTKINTFESITQAAKKCNINGGEISSCANKTKSKTAGGYVWKFIEQQNELLEGEEWKTTEQLQKMLQKQLKPENACKVKVSNKGRIFTAKGIITKGAKESQNGYYRKYAGWFVHQLVWITWTENPLPTKTDKFQIHHNDSIEKDEEGCVSNAIEHLSLGTPRENALSWHCRKRTFSQI